MIQNVPKILEKLTKVSSITQKKEILEQSKSDVFKYIFKMTYDPFITYGTVKVEISDIKFGTKEVDDRWLVCLRSLLIKLENRELTGNAARDEIRLFISVYPKEWGDLVLKILKKDLRIGAGASIINKIYPKLFPEDICMAAMKYDKKRVVYPVYADTKLDGVRCIADVENKKLFSRNGKEFKNYPTIMKELETLEFDENLRFDGEITMGHFQDLMRTVSRKDDGIELAKDAVYNIFDIIIEDTSFVERLNLLEAIRHIIEENKLEHLKVVTGKRIENENQLSEYYRAQLEAGYEGIMVKPFSGIYEFKRAYHWMKMKPESSEDLPIVRIEEGTGKYKDSLGAFVCKMPDGTEVNVGSGFTDEDRVEYWSKKNKLIGEIVEVKYQEKTKDGSLRFPVFMRFRPDK